MKRWMNTIALQKMYWKKDRSNAEWKNGEIYRLNDPSVGKLNNTMVYERLLLVKSSV